MHSRRRALGGVDVGRQHSRRAHHAGHAGGGLLSRQAHRLPDGVARRCLDNKANPPIRTQRQPADAACRNKPPPALRINDPVQLNTRRVQQRSTPRLAAKSALEPGIFAAG
jgi:hypothetical protein